MSSIAVGRALRIEVIMQFEREAEVRAFERVASELWKRQVSPTEVLDWAANLREGKDE